MPSTTQTLLAVLPLLSLTLAYGSPYSGNQNLYVRNANPESDLYDSALRLAARKASSGPQQQRRTANNNKNAPLRRKASSPLKTRTTQNKARSPKAKTVVTRKVASRQPKAQPHAYLQYDSGLWARDGGIASRDAYAHASAYAVPNANPDPWAYASAFADPDAFFEPEDSELVARNAEMEKEAREARRERRGLQARKRDASPLAEAAAVAEAIADAEADAEFMREEEERAKGKGLLGRLFGRWFS